jgi:hypothetical protein
MIEQPADRDATVSGETMVAPIRAQGIRTQDRMGAQ